MICSKECCRYWSAMVDRPWCDLVRLDVVQGDECWLVKKLGFDLWELQKERDTLATAYRLFRDGEAELEQQLADSKRERRVLERMVQLLYQSFKHHVRMCGLSGPYKKLNAFRELAEAEIEQEEGK